MKKLFGIHIVPMKKQSTNKNLMPHTPSWKIDAAAFLPRITIKTIKWKQARTKLILMIAEGPMHQLPSLLGISSTLGHCKASGKMSTSFLAVNSRIMETVAQNIWKTTYPIFAKFLDGTPAFEHSEHRQPQHAYPAQHAAYPAQHSPARHIFA